MATPKFIQRPRSFIILGFLGSRFVMRIRRRGFAPTAQLDVKLYPYNSAGIVSKTALVEELQPSLLPVAGEADTDELVIEGLITDQLTDEKYLAKFFVDGTVYGVAEVGFSNQVIEDGQTEDGGDYIQIGASGPEVLILMNPDAVKGITYPFTAEAPATNKQLFNHKLGSQLLKVWAYNQGYQLRNDVMVFPLRGVDGKDARDWAWLLLPDSVDAQDALIALHIEPIF